MSETVLTDTFFANFDLHPLLKQGLDAAGFTRCTPIQELTLPIAPKDAMIGVKPLFSDRNVAEGDLAKFDVAFVSPEGISLARSGLRYELLKLESRYQWYRQGSSWEYEPVKSTKRVADGDLTIAADKPARIEVAPKPGRYRLDVKSTEADGPLTSVEFDVGWYADGSADTPDLLETANVMEGRS